MRTVRFYPRRASTLHIEAPGCIVNITTTLTDTEGRKVTAIEIIADRYKGEEWHMPDFNQTQAMSVRVREGKPEKPQVYDLDSIINDLSDAVQGIIMETDNPATLAQLETAMRAMQRPIRAEVLAWLSINQRNQD